MRVLLVAAAPVPAARHTVPVGHLDAVEYQPGDRGGRIRAALAVRTGVATIPQLFVGGELVGGCTETLDAWRSGRLQSLLDASGVDYDRSVVIDPDSFLPGWLQRR